MKKYFSFFFVILFAFPAYADLEEDQAYEQQIHNIYLKHYKNPVSNSDWNNKIRSLPKNHKLKFKDNLWDLSGSFFKNPLYWSKLWVANPQVENPHLIYQGKSIKFDHQTLSNVSSSKLSVDIQSQFPGLIIPKSDFIKITLQESEIPSSLPKVLSFRPTSNEIDISQLQNIPIEKQVIIPFFLTDTNLSPVGKIISKNGYGKSISLGGEQLVVKINGEVSIGSVFTVFKNRGRIGDIYQFLKGLNEDEIAIKGKIKILSYLKGTNSLYMASVIESLQSIFTDDSLLQGEPPIYSFSQKGSIGNGSGLIIGTSDEFSNLLSLGSIVYLDRGIKDGVHKGKIFYIRGNIKKSNPFKRPYQYRNPILGKLKVIHTTGNKSTAIIVESKSHIHVGDIFTGNSTELEDLSESQHHETIEYAPEQGKELLIDFEEDPKNTSGW